jgi:hypothetical protein
LSRRCFMLLHLYSRLLVILYSYFCTIYILLNFGLLPSILVFLNYFTDGRMYLSGFSEISVILLSNTLKDVIFIYSGISNKKRRRIQFLKQKRNIRFPRMPNYICTLSEQNKCFTWEAESVYNTFDFTDCLVFFRQKGNW